MTARSLADIVRGRKYAGDADRPTDPVRRGSFHEDSRQAKPWRVHGDRDRRRWNAYKGAALGTFDAMRKAHLTALRAARRARRAGEDVQVPDAKERLHADDRAVLHYMLDRYNHMSGQLYPTYASIAGETGLSHGFVKAAMARLRRFGLMDWVRRTKTKEGAEGEAGPQLEQTSNAYFFAWAEQLVGAARETFLNLLTIALKKVTAARAVAPPSPLGAELQAALDRMREGIDRRDARMSSASPQDARYPQED